MDFAVHCDEPSPGSWKWELDVITTLERDMVLYLYELGVFAVFSHREHDGDIDKVKYEKRDAGIHFESDDEDALNYVMGFASKNEDNVRSKYVESKV